MSNLLVIIILLSFIVSCSNDKEESGVQIGRSNTMERKVFNPDLVPFSYFNKTTINDRDLNPRITFPISSPTNSRSGIIEVSNIEVGETIYLYNDSECLTTFLNTKLSEGNVENINYFLPRIDGNYSFFARVEGVGGAFSECMDLNLSISLDVTPPTYEKIQLNYPRLIESNIRDIKIELQGLEIGSRFEFFSDNSCNEMVFSDKNLNSERIIEIAPLDLDSLYNFSIIMVDEFGNKTKCLDTGVTYELDTIPPGPLIFEKEENDSLYTSIERTIVSIKEISEPVTFQLFEQFTPGNNVVVEDLENGENLENKCGTKIEDFPIEPFTHETEISFDRGEGEYKYFYRLIDDVGNISECFYSGISYVFDQTPPAPPMPENTTISDDEVGEFLFYVNLTHTDSRDSLSLFSDSECKNPLGIFTLEEGENTFNAGITELNAGLISIYGKLEDITGNVSECSSKIGEKTLDLKVYGTLTYDFVPVSGKGVEHDSTIIKPIRNAMIDLIDMNPLSVLYEESIGQTTSDDNGNYEFYLASPKDVKILVRAQMLVPDTVIQNPDAENARFVASTEVIKATSEELVNLHAASGWKYGRYSSERSAAPFAILDSIYTAYKKIIHEKPDLSFNRLYVSWGPENTKGAYYVPEDNTLFLKGKFGVETDEFDRHLVIHEWAHYFEDNLSRSDSMGGKHEIGDKKDMSLSFGEGFATAFSAMVFEPDARYVDTMWWEGMEYGFTMNIEDGGSVSDSNPGWFSEASIQEILYDICDQENDELIEDHDKLSLGIGPVIDIMTGPQITTPARTSIFSFITYLKELFPDKSSDIDLLTDQKQIEPITDIWGGNSQVYEDLISNTGVQTFSIKGGYLNNELVSNKHIRYKATSLKTRFTFQGTDNYLVDIKHNGESVYESGGGVYYNQPNELITVDLDTVIDDYYSIRVSTSQMVVDHGVVYVDISGEEN